MNKAAKRRQNRTRWEQRRRKRLKKRAETIAVVVERFGTGSSRRKVGNTTVRKAGGPKSVTRRPHR